MQICEALNLLRGGWEGIEEWNRRRRLGEVVPDLSGLDLRGAGLAASDATPEEDFVSADLSDVILRDADLQEAYLPMVDLSGADLQGTNLTRTNLCYAVLTETKLQRANLHEADLFGARFDRAMCLNTILTNLNLGEAEGLASVLHGGPSSIGIDTLIRSSGRIPRPFLQGCGLPGVWLAKIPGLMADIGAIRYFSCFISYSTSDEDFASRLYNDLQAVGIRCWKWDHDARTGRSLWGEIDRAIRDYDRLLLIASQSSLTSPQVNREIERAIQVEDRRAVLKHKGQYDGDIDVLLPVRLDDYILQGWEHERKADVVKKMIADATGWKTKRSVYTKVIERLFRDLKSDSPSAR